MILLGILLVIELQLCCWILGRPIEDFFFIHCDFPALVFVLAGVGAHIVILGRKKFLRGLSALIRLPKEADPEIAEYYGHLTWFTLLLGVVGMAFFAVDALCYIDLIDFVGSPVALSIFIFNYAGWLALALFWPISIRYAVGSESAFPSKLRFPVGTTLLGITAFFLTRALMAIVFVSMASFLFHQLLPKGPGEAEIVVRLAAFSFNPADWSGNMLNYLSPQLYFDLPSFVLILLSLGGFRLAAGRLKNRFIWIPVSILLGVLWTLEGLVLMLTDLDPDKISSGYLVALLTAFYGFIAAVLFAIGSKRITALFFLSIPMLTLTWGVLAFADRMQEGYRFTLEECTAFLVVFMLDYALATAFGLIFWGGVKEIAKRFSRSSDGPLPPEEEQARQILDSAVTRQRYRQSPDE